MLPNTPPPPPSPQGNWNVENFGKFDLIHFSILPSRQRSPPPPPPPPPGILGIGTKFEFIRFTCPNPPSPAPTEIVLGSSYILPTPTPKIGTSKFWQI